MPTEQIEKLTFKKIIMTIGNLPSSYVESLSYYECMLWLCNYLETVVVPTVNGNAEAVEELQELFVELKTYVDNYLTDANLQPMIDHKLDEMAEDGTLADIVAQYVALQGLLVYNNVEEMKEATNVTVGSFLQTYGYYEVGDGGSARYKARQITSDDVVDGSFIIALHDNTLVAELVHSDYIDTMQLGIKPDGETDYTNIFKKLASKESITHINVPYGEYVVSDTITFAHDVDIDFNNSVFNSTAVDETFIFEGTLKKETSGSAANGLPDPLSSSVARRSITDLTPYALTADI